MDGDRRDVPLKAKYRAPKPKGKYRADYNGNTGLSRRHKHVPMPDIPGIKRKKLARKY